MLNLSPFTKLCAFLQNYTRFAHFAAFLIFATGYMEAQTAGTPFTSFLTKDFLPGAVSRAGAVSTFSEDPMYMSYNPALGLFAPKATKVFVSLSHSFLPLDTYLESASVYFKTKDGFVNIMGVYLGSDAALLSEARDKYGDINSQTFMFQISSGFFFPKSAQVGFGYTVKYLGSRAYVNERNMLGVDAGVIFDIPKQKMRFAITMLNLGFDMKVLAKLDYTTIINKTNADQSTIIIPNNPYLASFPTSFDFGFQYQFFNLFNITADLSYTPPSPDDVKNNGAGFVDGIFLPKVALSIIALPNVRLNVGRSFRNAAGESYFTFGAEFTLTLGTLPPININYAFEPIPNFTDNHYLSLGFRFL
jgi:hypothetical protein